MDPLFTGIRELLAELRYDVYVVLLLSLMNLVLFVLFDTLYSNCLKAPRLSPLWLPVLYNWYAIYLVWAARGIVKPFTYNVMSGALFVSILCLALYFVHIYYTGSQRRQWSASRRDR